MKENNFDVARIELLRDALISEFDGARHRWHVWEGAGLAAMGIAFVGVAQGQLTAIAFMMVLGVGAVGVGFASSRLDRIEREFESLVRILAHELESLKKTRAPSEGA